MTTQGIPDDLLPVEELSLDEVLRGWIEGRDEPKNL